MSTSPARISEGARSGDQTPGAAGSRRTARSEATSVLSQGRYRYVFATLGVVIAFGYSLLLPFAFTQRVSVANWRYLGLRDGLFSVALGAAVAFVLTLQIASLRRLARSRGTGLTGLALVAGVLPSLACCSPLVPTILSAAGVSAVGVYSTSVPVQRFFAVHETALLAGSLGLFLLNGWWAARRLARSACLEAGACPIPDGDGGDD